jgi:hypothetical protein
VPTMRLTRMRAYSLVALLLTALVGGACGNAQTPREIVAGAAVATTAAKSSKLDIRVGLSGVMGGADSTMAGVGAFDYAANKGTMIMTMPTGSSSMTLEMVMLGTLVYEKLPDVAAKQFGGKPWLKIDLVEMSKVAGFDLSTLASSQSSNPAQALEFLRGTGADVREIGKDTLRGTKTTHYQFTVDVTKAAASAPASQKKALDQLAEIYKNQHLSVEAWIDGDGRMRKMVYEVDLSKLNMPASAAAKTGGKPLTGKILTTLELYDFGTTVKAEAPPADQVTDFQQLMSSMSAGTASGSGTATKP